MRALNSLTWRNLVAYLLCSILTALATTLSVACSSPSSGPPGTAERAPATSVGTPSSEIWSALHQRTPYPYTTPLPPPTPTFLDGMYAKFDPSEATPIPCRRCPDYKPERGVWKLSMDKGIYRVFYQVTGWRSMGSFTVSGDRLALFNDPCCIETVGIYKWKLESGQLSLEVVEDTCAIGLRAKNLTHVPWLSCQQLPAGGDGSRPPGCD